MNKFTIFIDMDGTICDLVNPWLTTYNEVYGANLSYNDIKEYDIEKIAQSGGYIYKVLTEYRIFRTLPAYPNAIETVRILNEKHDVYLTTQASNPIIIEDKFYWIEKNMPFIKPTQIIFIQPKHLLQGHILIDEHPAYIQNFRGITIMPIHPYNRNVISEFKFYPEHGWTSVINIVERIYNDCTTLINSGTLL